MNFRNVVESPFLHFGVLLSIYPILTITLFNVEHQFVRRLPGIYPTVTDDGFFFYFLISTCAISGYFFSIFIKPYLRVGRKLQLTFPRQQQFKGGGYLFLVGVLILLLEIVLIWVYRKSIIGSYVFSDLRNGVRGGLAQAVNVISLFDIFFVALCSLAIKNNYIKRFSPLVLIFVVIKLLMRCRMALLFVFLTFIYAYIIRDKKIKFSSLAILSSSFLVLLMLVSFVRHSEGKNSGLQEFCYEFVYCSASVFNLHQKLETTDAHEGKLFLLDPLISLAPSFLISREELAYNSWRAEIGGFKHITPLGGFYLPAQFFLFTRSYAALFCCFFILGVLIQYLTNLVIVRRSMLAVLTIAYLITFVPRMEYWVSLKNLFYLLAFYGVADSLLATGGNILQLKICRKP